MKDSRPFRPLTDDTEYDAGSIAVIAVSLCALNASRISSDMNFSRYSMGNIKVTDDRKT